MRGGCPPEYNAPLGPCVRAGAVTDNASGNLAVAGKLHVDIMELIGSTPDVGSGTRDLGGPGRFLAAEISCCTLEAQRQVRNNTFGRQVRRGIQNQLRNERLSSVIIAQRFRSGQ